MIELATQQVQDPETAKRKVRDDLEMATAIMSYAIRKNLGGFHFSGLRIPWIIQIWEAGHQLPEVESFATEVAVFQEHLHERIAALCNNQQMVREIWNVNERTRHFRECELRIPETARDVLDKTTSLVNALFNRNEELCSTILMQCAERRFGLIAAIMCPVTSMAEKPPRSTSYTASPQEATTLHR